MSYHADIERSRADRDRYFAEHYASPLSEDDQAAFVGLDYFAPAERWRLAARFRPVAPERIDVPSSNGGIHPYARIGWATIELEASTLSLAVFDDGDGDAFIPFADTTNGVETYGGGRYVSIDVGEDGAATVDFNEARNPYCAYDIEFVCPLPPSSNRIDARVDAGERDFRPRRIPES